MDEFLEFLAVLGRAIAAVLTFDTSDGAWLAGYRYLGVLAITVAVLAGISTLLGDSVVLFLNGIRGARFAISLAVNSLGFVLLYAVQALVIASVGYSVTGERLALTMATWAVLLSTAPHLFGFFALIPYLGPGIARILQAWGVVSLWVIVGALYRVERLTALLITLAGWGAMQLVSWLLSGPLSVLGRWVWRLTTGQATMLTAQDLLSGHLFAPVDLGIVDRPKTRRRQGGAP